MSRHRRFVRRFGTAAAVASLALLPATSAEAATAPVLTGSESTCNMEIGSQCSVTFTYSGPVTMWGNPAFYWDDPAFSQAIPLSSGIRTNTEQMTFVYRVNSTPASQTLNIAGWEPNGFLGKGLTADIIPFPEGSVPNTNPGPSNTPTPTPTTTPTATPTPTPTRTSSPVPTPTYIRPTIRPVPTPVKTTSTPIAVPTTRPVTSNEVPVLTTGSGRPVNSGTLSNTLPVAHVIGTNTRCSFRAGELCETVMNFDVPVTAFGNIGFKWKGKGYGPVSLSSVSPRAGVTGLTFVWRVQGNAAKQSVMRIAEWTGSGYVARTVGGAHVKLPKQSTVTVTGSGVASQPGGVATGGIAIGGGASNPTPTDESTYSGPPVVYEGDGNPADTPVDVPVAEPVMGSSEADSFLWWWVLAGFLLIVPILLAGGVRVGRSSLQPTAGVGGGLIALGGLIWFGQPLFAGLLAVWWLAWLWMFYGRSPRWLVSALISSGVKVKPVEGAVLVPTWFVMPLLGWLRRLGR